MAHSQPFPVLAVQRRVRHIQHTESSLRKREAWTSRERQRDRDGGRIKIETKRRA